MKELVKSAEAENVVLARAFANTIWPRFSSYVTSVSEADGDALRERLETQEIHDALKTLTTGLPVLKVKIYNLDGYTIYSSQFSQIGTNKSNNLGFLQSAREGVPASKLSYRDTFSAYSGAVENRDLVESYLPILGPEGAIEGVFELYTDVTPLMARINGLTIRLAFGLVVIFGLSYAALFLIIRRADQILKKQNLDLRASEAKIKAKNVLLEDQIAERTRAVAAAREAERRLASITAAIPGVVYQRQVTPEGDIRYTYISKGAQDLFGVSPEEIMADPQALFDCHGPTYRATFRDRLLAASDELEMWDVEAQIITRDGQEKWTHAIARPQRQPDGSVLWDGVILDATRIKKAEFELRKAKEAAEAADRSRETAEAASRAKSEFLAAMSHELRTPLNAIIGFSEIMMLETLAPMGIPKYREYAKDIHDAGQHLLYLINNILDLSKIETGKDELHEEDIQIRGLARSVFTLVKERAQDGGIDLDFDLANDLPLLHADERKLKQVLVNLLSNAIKFTEPGGKVTLKSRFRSDHGHMFQIIDTGIGIAPEDIPNALSKFGQVDSGLNRKYEGTGLGLPLATALVELQGGSLDLQSEVGVGTTVTVRYPAGLAARSADDSQALGVGERHAS